MAQFVILDGDLIQNAFKAGGIPLVEKYFSFFDSRGVQVVMADLVYNTELANFPNVAALRSWIDGRGIQVIETTENVKWLAHIADGGDSTNYPDNKHVGRTKM